MQVVKVVAKIVNDNSGVYTEIPVLLDYNNVFIKPLVEYALKLKCDGMSQSTINKHIRSTQLLLEYMAANEDRFISPQSMFESFCSRLYTGTIGNDGLDPSGLYWLPCSKEVAQSHINALSRITDWLADKYGSVPVNPLISADSLTQRLNYAAWFRKNQHNFLGHTKDKHINTTVLYARNVKGKRSLGNHSQDAIEFPEKYFKQFYFEGLGKRADRRASLRDQLILLLMHGGGLRESEALHLWIEDVLVEPFNPNSVRVHIYHPEDGRAPNDWKSSSGKTTRAAYLRENYALSPRNGLMGKKHVGWKSRVLDSKDKFLVVHWFPAIFGQVFSKLWQDYTKYLTFIERNHPYAFINFHPSHLGTPYTLNAFHDNYSRGLKRIGLKPSKANGLSPHSHRHSYGRRLRRAGVQPILISKCLHHSSLESQIVYTMPTVKEVTRSLDEATLQLLNPAEPLDQTHTPSWEALLEHGFDDIDPNGLFTGKHPKLGRHHVG